MNRLPLLKRLTIVTTLIAAGLCFSSNARAQDKPAVDKHAAVKKELKLIAEAAVKYAKDNGGAFPYFKLKEQQSFQKGLKLLIEKKYLKEADLNPAIKKDDMIGFFLELPKNPKKPQLICGARSIPDKKMFFGLTDGSVVTLDASSKTFRSEIQKYLPESILRRPRVAGNEASAIGSLRALNASQAIHLERGAKQTYGTLKELTEANYIDKVLGSGKKQGYIFKIHVGDKDGKNGEYVYHITATPIKIGETGNRHFYTDQMGVIRVENGKPATAKSPALGAARKKEAAKSSSRGTTVEANEASAIGSLRTLNASQAIHLERGAKQTYGTLKELTEANYIDKVLGSGKKQGYIFKIHVGDKDGKNGEYVYHITATPIEVGKTGKRHFFTDQSGVVRVETGKPATKTSKAIGAK